jgi:hypothetical protein
LSKGVKYEKKRRDVEELNTNLKLGKFKNICLRKTEKESKDKNRIIKSKKIFIFTFFCVM